MTTVADIMTSGVYAFAQDTSIQTAARIMKNRHISGAPVIEPSGRPIGIITLADLVASGPVQSPLPGYPLFYHLTDHSVEELGDASEISHGQVADVMSPFVLSIEASATLEQAAKRMLAEGVHRLLVMNDACLVGIVTSIDLLRGFVLRQNGS